MSEDVGGDAVELADLILRNHREELARLASGERPKYNSYHRWDEDQLRIYKGLLELESVVLERILAPERGAA